MNKNEIIEQQNAYYIAGHPSRKALATSKPTYAELEKENAELKSRDCWKSCEYANPKSELIVQHIKDVQQLTKAKEIIKDFLLMAKVEHLKDRYETVDEAEQFLKEAEMTEEQRSALKYYDEIFTKE